MNFFVVRYVHMIFEYEKLFYIVQLLYPYVVIQCVGQCIDIIRHQTKCPQDQVPFGTHNVSLDQLPTNYPLLIILYESSKVNRIFPSWNFLLLLLFVCLFFFSLRLVT